MAIMYPSVFPGPADPAVPEFQTYETLRCLSDHYHVFYSKRFAGGLFGKAECEIDFIVFNGRDVITCIEVKGGLISYDGAERRWLQNGRPCKDILRQAADASHTLGRALAHELKDASVDWALCFPDCCLISHAGAFEIQPAQILDQKAMLNISSAMQRLESHIRGKYGSRPGLSPPSVRSLISRLTRSIGFVEILGVRIAHEAKQILQVTDEQLEVLTDVEENDCMLVHGAAGTGKTIIAQTFAKRLAEANQRVLLLFYNRSIATTVRQAFDRHSTVQVSTFSSFGKRLVEAIDPEWWEAQGKKDDEFWQTALPIKLLDIPSHNLPTFDAVIVDEGQDFKPEWFEFLRTVLRNGEDTHYTVFLDEHQDIFKHWKHFPCQPRPAKKVLTKNCRNTRAIVEFLNQAYPTNMTSFGRSPLGSPVVQRTTRDDKDELSQLTSDITRLIRAERIQPGSIVILIQGPKEESCLRDVVDIGGYELRSTFGRYDRAARCVYYATIEIFKGLESDVIHLVLGDRSNSSDVAKTLYVQGSRAKHLLYVYRRAEAM